MDSMELRLNILNQSGIITDEEKGILLKWIEIIKDYSSDYNSEKLERMITHCAMMMKRTRDNEAIGSLPDEIFESVKEHDRYQDCLQLFNKMNELYPVNSEEEKYLILHLCSCFEKE